MSRTLLRNIEIFLKEADMPPSVFGRYAARDPRLVSDIRAGREIGSRLKLRIENYMQHWRAEYQQRRVRPIGDKRVKIGSDNYLARQAMMGSRA
jgi:hypothetical protein